MPKIRALIVDDFQPNKMDHESYRNMFYNLEDAFELIFCENAGEVLDWIETNGAPDVLIAENRIAYGSAHDVLLAETDPNMDRTGLRLINYIREELRLTNLWIMFFPFIQIERFSALEIINDNGKIYIKPYDTFTFIVDLCAHFGVDHKIPEYLLEP